jgi:hypothetical protein
VNALAEASELVVHTHDADIKMVEIDVSRTAYDGGHIPRAVLRNVYADLLQPKYRIVERESSTGLLERPASRRA